ncbi:protein kinase [Actinoallomurus spadix]|nr:protein kinase [Actinoallomurus spadix]
MGTVWRAHDDLLARDVAVKEVLFPPGLSDDERKVMYERTLREARSAARLNHPGIVTVHDVVEEDGRPCIVMEFVQARSLQEVIDEEGRLPPAQVAEIGAQVLAALRTAHAAGITHRDVKPANVLLAGAADEPISRSTRVVITDFGIATMEGDSTLTQTGLIMGSPAYIAPERARGDKASPASDLWSLGATLYAAVEGRSPHHRSEAMAALASVLSEEAPPPRHAGPLAPVLMGLLDKDPARRLTADQTAEGLTRAAHGTSPLPTSGPAPGDSPAAGNGPVMGTGPGTGPGSAMGTGRGNGPGMGGAPAAGTGPGAGNGAGTGPEGPPVPWRLAADTPPPPRHPSAAMADPLAGGRTYDPATARDFAPTGVGGPDPGGPPAPDPAGPSGPAFAPQDEAWMRAYDRATAPVATRTRVSRRRAVAITLAAVIVAVAIGLALPIDYSGGGERTPTPFDAGTKQPSPSASRSVSKTPAPTVPAGYHKVTTQDGSTLVVPRKWQHMINTSQSELWIDQATGSRVQVDTIPWKTSDPVQHWVQWGRKAPDNLPGFQWVARPHAVTERGWEAGDAEYSWTAGSHGTLYAIDRGFTVGRTQYSIMAADGSGKTARTYFDEVFRSFQPGAR